MRRDPDGPDNIHPLGEPCQTAAECKEVFTLDLAYRRFFHSSQWRDMVAEHRDNVSRRPSVTRHTADVSHVEDDGRLHVVVGSFPSELERMGSDPGFISASQGAQIMLESRGKDYRLIQNEKISGAILKERALAGEPLKSVTIHAHGVVGGVFEQSEVGTSIPWLVADIMPALAPGATLDFTGCNLAQTPQGRELLQVVANRHGVIIRANGNLGVGSDVAARRHAYVFTPNRGGETQYENTAIYKEDMAARRQEVLNKLRSSGGPR